MPSNHLILCHPLLLLPSIFPSFRVFSSESALHIRWPKYWNIRFSISPSIENSGLISFRIDSFDLLATQGTLKHLLQHHDLKASILQCSTFFMVHLSHLYMTIAKTIALTRQTFVSKQLTFFIWWRVFTSVKQLGKCASDAIIYSLGTFQRGAKAEDLPVPGRSMESCSVSVPLFPNLHSPSSATSPFHITFNISIIYKTNWDRIITSLLVLTTWGTERPG